MLKTLKNCALFTLGCLAMANAQATVIGGDVTTGSGSFIKLTIPFSESTPDNTVGNNTFQNNNLYAFDEGQNILLGASLVVDEGGIGGLLSSGTLVASHYVFFDPNGGTHQAGYVDFDSAILGVITSTDHLAASDFLLNNGVTYLNPTARGLEDGDFVSFSGSRVYVDWTASTPGDYVRVLTAFSPAAVPETSALTLLALGMAGLFLSRRRHA